MGKKLPRNLNKIRLYLFYYGDREKRCIDNDKKAIYYIIRFNLKEGLLSMLF